MPGYEYPMALRRIDEESYCFVGNVFIGCLEQAECFEEGNLPELVEFRIR